MRTNDRRQTHPTGQGDSAKAKVSMRQAAYERIEELLNSGELRPGQLITQRELVEMTGLTLGSVREAVPRLEAEGLLQTLPKRGLMVPSLDVTFVRDAYQMREVIELAAIPDMIGSLAKQRVEGWIDWHHRALERISSEEMDTLVEESQRLDWAMHDAFVGAMHNALISNVYRVTAIKIRMAVQSRIKVTSLNVKRVINEHLRILKALHDGDAPCTRDALAFHLDNSLKLALGVAVD